MTKLRKSGSTHLTLVPPVIIAAPARIVPRNDIVHEHACVHCHQPCEGQFNLGGDRWHWDCWLAAHPRRVSPVSSHHIDTTYLNHDPEDGTEEGWYAIIRTDSYGADMMCGPYETETRAVDAAKKQSRGMRP